MFLFDEPLSNLDAELRVQMRAEISKLQHRLKTTTVYVTHDQVEAMTLGHRIAVLAPMGKERKTNLKQVGTPLELYDRPQNVFVAKFIGTPNMNMVKATVNGDAHAAARPAGFATAGAAEAGATGSGRSRAARCCSACGPSTSARPGAHDWTADRAARRHRSRSSRPSATR